MTEAFGFRIFGTLNSTGPFAGYLTFAILINLPRLRLSRWWISVMLAPCLIALVLTEVRAAWLGLAVGAIVYLLFSPLRGRVLLPLFVASLSLLATAAILLSTVKGSEVAFSTFTDRLATFSSLNNDASANVRKDETLEGLHDALTEPLGFGLGSVGLGSKLIGGPGGTIDNGYISRFLELGYFGFGLYIAAVLFAFWATLRSFQAFRIAWNLEATNIAAIAVAIQLLILGLETASDSHLGFAGMWFWYSLFLAAAYSAPSGGRVENSSVTSAPLRVRLASQRAPLDASTIPGIL